MYKKLGILTIAVTLLLFASVGIGTAIVKQPENKSVPAPGVVTPPDSGTGYLGDITIQGTAISQFNRIGAWGWMVHIDKVVDGPVEIQNKSMSIYLTSADPAKYPRGSIDPNIRVGDRVEAHGDYSTGSTNILLTGDSNYYLKKIEMVGTPKQRRSAGC